MNAIIDEAVLGKNDGVELGKDGGVELGFVIVDIKSSQVDSS